jgi:hypothetical protein
MRKKKRKVLRDPYEMYLLVFQERMEVSTMPDHNENKYKNYDGPGEQLKAAVILAIAHAAYAKEHPTEMSVKPTVPWAFNKFREYFTELFKDYKHAARED